MHARGGREVGDEQLPQKEDVGAARIERIALIGSIQREDVGSIVQSARVVDIDNVIRPAGTNVHHIAVRIPLAIEVHRIAQDG